MTFEELLHADVKTLEELSDEQLDAILDPVLKQCPPVELVAYMEAEQKKKDEKKAQAKAKRVKEKQAKNQMTLDSIADTLKMLDKLQGKS